MRARPNSVRERRPWLGSAITYHMGVDGISLPFVILDRTAADLHHCELRGGAAARRIHDRVPGLETRFGTFSALDLVLFYLFFEGGLIPMF